MIEDNLFTCEVCGHELVRSVVIRSVVSNRAFKEIFDEPDIPMDIGQKGDRLKERLSGEEVNLKEIIYEFGFSSPAHFTKFCKKWLGMTPTKFIEEQKMTGEHIDL